VTWEIDDCMFTSSLDIMFEFEDWNPGGLVRLAFDRISPDLRGQEDWLCEKLRRYSVYLAHFGEL
jgi:hypothetical protein